MLKLKRFFSLWISFAWLPAIVFCIPETVFAQTSSGQLQNAEQTIKSKLSDNFKQFPLEKVFVHTDQNSYQSGETIWYKACCQSYGKPTELSRILYVRLLDSSGKAVNENKLYLNDGAAQGNLDLSDSLKTGWYELQAFTAWMLNFKGYGFFKQQIYFRNKNDQAGSASNEPKKATYKIHFYPEGGEIVDGNLCSIAFKATDESDRPVFASGEIYGDKNTPVIRFKSIHDGMGQFELEAVAGISYVTRVHFPDHSVQTISLPVVQKNGICMKVRAIPAHKFEVKISYSGLEKKKDIIVEIKQSNGRSLVYSSSLERGTNVYSIDKESFSKGIIRITVYNSLGIPVAERIVYNDAPQETLHVSVDQKTVFHTPKGKNELLFSIKDDAGNPVKGSFSVSVNHSGSVGDNIISCLSLSAELTGFINQPANYFKNNSDSLKQYLDLVMLTNGYRHFTKLLSENDKNVQIKYAVEKKQVITGKVMNGAFNPAEPLNLTISNADSSVYFLKVFPDSSGRFFVDNYIKPGKATIYADKLIKKNLIPVKIQLDQAVYNVNDIEK